MNGLSTQQGLFPWTNSAMMVPSNQNRFDPETTSRSNLDARSGQCNIWSTLRMRMNLLSTFSVQMELGRWKTLSRPWLQGSTGTHFIYGPKGWSIIWCHKSSTTFGRVENSCGQRGKFSLVLFDPNSDDHWNYHPHDNGLPNLPLQCSKPVLENYQPPSPVNPTFQATAPPSVVTPLSTSAQQVFVKYVT